MKLCAKTKEYAPSAWELRKALHRIPEESCAEFKTSAFIYDFLKNIKGCALTRPVETGVKAVFDTGAKKTIGIRADIDGLPVTEETGLSFTSEHKGVMHACGHDGHTAVVLALAKMAGDNISTLKNNYVFLFQPAEETIGGAKPMIDAGALESPHIDEIYGVHFWPDVEKGKIAAANGAQMANMWDANVEIEGRGAHGAAPQEGVDALLAAASFVMQANTIMQRSVDPFSQAVYNIGKMEAGEARNVVARTAVIEGTIRSFSDDTAAIIKKRIQSIMAGVDAAFGTKSRYYHTMEYPALINSHALYERLAGKFSPDEWYTAKPVMMAEDFSFYTKERPALFAFVGMDSSPLHSPTFDIKESDIETAMEFFIRMCF